MRRRTQNSRARTKRASNRTRESLAGVLHTAKREAFDEHCAAVFE
jgi:hypothetical protein